jgi:ribonuclease BN (tRNA processing enzyme)
MKSGLLPVPGTEKLKKDEIRLIACGTGLPAARRDQAATCFLAEVGNGDKFLFDIGTGSMVNVAALMIPYDFLDKVFLTHLHTDHWGDLDRSVETLGAHRGDRGYGNGVCGGSLLENL